MPDPKKPDLPIAIASLLALVCLCVLSLWLFTPTHVSAALPGYLATIPDITGTGAAVPLTASHVYASSIEITCASTNSAVVRFGDSNVSTSRGVRCAAGGTQMLSTQGPYFDLSTVYLYIASNDVVSVTYVVYQLP